MSSPDVSIIVVTHEGRERALETLRSAHGALGAVKAQWLVVDSGSTDGTPEAIEREFPALEVTRLANVGFAAANNTALRSASGRYVLLLNPDIEIVDGTVEELVAMLDARPEVGVASVTQLWPDGALQHTIRRFPSPTRQLGEALLLSRLPPFAHLREEEGDEEVYSREVSADWLVGSFLLVRRDAIDTAGLLDERFFLFSEETDWCRRLRSAGWDIRHFPAMTAIHHTGRMMRPDLYAQNSHSKLLYGRKHFRPLGRIVFRGSLALRHALRVAALAPAAAARPALRGRAHAEARALRVVLGLTPPPLRPRT